MNKEQCGELPLPRKFHSDHINFAIKLNKTRDLYSPRPPPPFGRRPPSLEQRPPPNPKPPVSGKGEFPKALFLVTKL